MPPLPTVSGPELIQVLEAIGFTLARSPAGSHHVMRHPDGRWVSIPVHGRKAIATGTLRGILRRIDLPVADLIKLLND